MKKVLSELVFEGKDIMEKKTKTRIDVSLVGMPVIIQVYSKGKKPTRKQIINGAMSFRDLPQEAFGFMIGEMDCEGFYRGEGPIPYHGKVPVQYYSKP